MINVYSLLVVSGWLIIVLSISFFCKKKYPKEKELSRKIVHIGSGPIIPLAWSLNISNQIAIPVAAIITIALMINYQIKIFNSIEDIERKSFGTISYGLSITLLIILFWSDAPSAVISGVLVMAFGDGLAGLIGPKIQSPNWTIFGQKKSVVGTATMLLASFIVLFIVNEITLVNIEPMNILAIACLAVVLEQVSVLGVDNLTGPLGVAFSWHMMLLN